MIEILISIIFKKRLDKQSIRAKIESEVDNVICYYHCCTCTLMEMHGALQKSGKTNTFS